MVPPVKLTALREAAIQACDAFIGTIRDAHDKFSPLIAAIDPGLSAFRANGSKMVFWHG